MSVYALVRSDVDRIGFYANGMPGYCKATLYDKIPGNIGERETSVFESRSSPFIIL